MKDPLVPNPATNELLSVGQDGKLSSPLRDLARNVKKDHKAALAGLSNVLVHVYWVGVRLIEAKQSVAPKAFLGFLRSCFDAGDTDVSVRMCQRYMRVARRLSEQPGFTLDSATDTAATRTAQRRLLDDLGVSSIRQVLGQKTIGGPSMLQLPSGVPCSFDLVDTTNSDSRSELLDNGLASTQIGRPGAIAARSSSHPHIAAAKCDAEDDDDHFITPQHLIEAVLEVFDNRLDLDPCASANRELWLPAQTSLTADDDPLSNSSVWRGRVFVHPPLSRLEVWVWKAVKELLAGHAQEMALLVPSNTDADFNAPIQPYPRAYLRSRLSFATPAGSVRSAATPYMLVYLGEESRFEDFAYAVGGHGDVYFAFRFL